MTWLAALALPIWQAGIWFSVPTEGNYRKAILLLGDDLECAALEPYAESLTEPWQIEAADHPAWSRSLVAVEWVIEPRGDSWAGTGWSGITPDIVLSDVPIRFAQVFLFHEGVAYDGRGWLGRLDVGEDGDALELTLTAGPAAGAARLVGCGALPEGG